MVQNDFRVDVVESVEIAVVDLVEIPVVDSAELAVVESVETVQLAVESMDHMMAILIGLISCFCLVLEKNVVMAEVSEVDPVVSEVSNLERFHI